METNSFKKCPTLEEIVDRAILQVKPDTSVLEAAVLMSQEQAKGCVLVVDGALLLGIFTERDVVKITASGVDLSSTEIAQVIAQPLISLTLDDKQNVLTALSVMRQHQIRHLPLVDNRRQLIGLVTQEQIYQAIAPLEQLEEISERKRLEVELQQREAFLSSIYDGAEQSMFVVDVTEANDFRYVSFNRSAQQSVGVSLQDIQDKTPEEVFGTQTGKIFRQNYQRCVQADSSITYEDHFIFDDRPAWTLTTLAPLRNQEGRIYRLVGTAIEITDRKQAEAALRESEAEFRAMFNVSSVGMAQVDIQTRRFRRVNAAFGKITGYTEAELLALTVDDINHPDDRDRDRQLYINLLNGDSYQSEKRYLRKDGSSVWVLATGNLIRDAQGQPLRAFAIIQDISEKARIEAERQQAEAAMRLSEAQRRLALDLTNTASWDLDIAIGKVLWSDYMFSLFGLTPGAVEPSYSAWRNCVHPEDIDRLESAVANHLQNRTLYNEEYRVVYPDGSIHWVLSRGRGIYDATGQPVRMVGITMDISDRKQLELSLQASQAKLSRILDSAFAAISSLRVYANRDWQYEYWSAGCERLFGYSLAEYADKYFWMSQVLPEDREHCMMPLFDDFFAERDATIEYRFRRKDGSIRWFSSSYTSQQIAEDCWIVTTVNHDISDRKLAEQKIAEQAALIDIATDAFLVQDLDNRILFCSKGAECLYGWTAAETLGKIVHELFNTEPRSQLAEGLKTVVAQGFWQGELEQFTKSGKKIIVASRWTLVRDESSQPKSILVVNSDITEKKNLEEQFYRAQRLESIGTLASGIAHDFNNLLTPILAVSQLLPLKFRDLDDQTRHFLTMLEESAKRGTNLVKQLLSFSRGTQGKRLIIQLGHLLSELVTVAQSTFPKSIDISREIPTRELWLISADSTQIHQVFMNILVNARDAMPNGGNLTISAENRYLDENYARINLEAHVGSYIVIKISDTGTGIPSELMERIFDPFFTTKEVGKGTGLGLATVLGIVKNHGGFVKVDSEVGKGTQFEVFLPAVEGAVSQPNSENELPTGNDELILIVDDEQSIQEITKTSLENYNYRTLLASDGIEAIATYAKHKEEISIVLIDLMMPNLDGLTAIRAMQLINPQVKVIPTSGLPASAQKALPANIKTFLLKPYTLEELLNAINSI
ncbi:MAG: PAS domain S-box protein [Aulosira sp. ZfuVER01]|nr:PAS domain S-box protein [Aulosira sp. ZfuVER01]MDZ8000450.1 PAS domain S-box protein [Aulosira sp. DedVER01a]MDZ8052922.1 PAS domain S-box protein [Aulosira sp. ZfuCHP01]